MPGSVSLSGRPLEPSLSQDINKSGLKTDNDREFGDGENAEFETVFVLKDFDTPDYNYLYTNDNRIVGPPVVLYCAGREEVRRGQDSRGGEAHLAISLAYQTWTETPFLVFLCVSNCVCGFFYSLSRSPHGLSTPPPC